MSELRAAALIAIGTVAFLDRWPAVQAMVSRPIVVGTAAGLALGDPAGGALWGAAFEAMYLGLLPVGAARLPDAGTATLAGTTVALVGATGGAYPAALAAATGWLAGHVGETGDGLQRRWNGALAARAAKGAAAGDPGAPGRAIGVALAAALVLGAALSALAVAGAVGVVALAGAGPLAASLEAGTLRLAVLAALAVEGGRAFLERDRASGAAWSAGALAGALLVWAAG